MAVCMPTERDNADCRTSKYYFEVVFLPSITIPSGLHVWLKRDQLGFGLQTQPVRGRETALHPAAESHRDGVEEMPPIDSKLSRRITKTSYKTSLGYPAIHTEADAKTNRKKQRIHCLKFAREDVH